MNYVRCFRRKLNNDDEKDFGIEVVTVNSRFVRRVYVCLKQANVNPVNATNYERICAYMY